MSGLPELAALRQIVIEAANKAGLSEICLHPAESKADGSIVTALDHEMQALISAQLEARWPQYLFMGEEMDHGEQARIVDGEQRGFWTLDPLDGTTNFAMGFPFYGVSLALVIDGERCLLARRATIDIPRFSTVAGFVEPGETLEDAVRREVAEEVGVLTGSVMYRASQPWPFPSSLMMGFWARATSSAIKVDGEEIGEAAWFTRGDIERALAADAAMRTWPQIGARRGLGWARLRCCENSDLLSCCERAVHAL